MELTAKQRQYLRGLGHAQKALVQIGAKGMGEGLVGQISAQLEAHELLKIRFNTESSVEPEEVTDQILTETRSELVQRRGRTLLIYRRRQQKPGIELPKAEREGTTRSA